MDVIFMVKKIINFIFYPLSIAVLLFFAGVLLRKRGLYLAKIFFLTTVVWIVLASSWFFADVFLGSLEKQFPKLNKPPENIEYILLLGGERERRAWEALRLYRLLEHVKIVTSGPLAKRSKNLLVASGVKGEDIEMQLGARDTIEEAEYMKKRIGGKPFILITSAYHMPRAMEIFRMKKMHPIAAPADFDDHDQVETIPVLSAKELVKTAQALHEYIGLFWIKIKAVLAGFLNYEL